VTVQQKPPYRRRKLGKRLRTLRESAGMSMDEAAAKLDKNRSSLHRIESGVYKADVHLVRSMMDVYDRFEAGLLDEVRDALKPSWFSTYGVQDMGYVDVEDEAVRVSEYSCQVLPGLLQSEAYIRAVIEGSRTRRTPKQVDGQVIVRLIRQKRLTSEENRSNWWRSSTSPRCIARSADRR
jgi:transcriptional regulator with XRE-family HTH domain